MPPSVKKLKLYQRTAVACNEVIPSPFGEVREYLMLQRREAEGFILLGAQEEKNGWDSITASLSLEAKLTAHVRSRLMLLSNSTLSVLIAFQNTYEQWIQKNTCESDSCEDISDERFR
ncbi:hypothetical protein AVEN_84199-1 [Araneus ventricosus]|uniref:Uncharacterized protein n=1 Tax=Araneus ventricosus TaxID=182803 RepID=A0A4Y2D9K9_ARAVE|nr:hypothetical protein AVEN_84199-1 [Araneus ventricosus]